MSTLIVVAANLRSPHLRNWEQLFRDQSFKLLAVETHANHRALRALASVVIGLVRMRLHVREARHSGKHVVVQAHGAGRSALLTMLFLDSHPMVIVHGSEVLRGSERPYFIQRLTAAVLSRARTIVITSEATREHVLGLSPMSAPKIHLIHPGIEWELFSSSRLDRSTNSEIVCASVRRILPLYHIHDLVDAFFGLDSSVPCRLKLLTGDVSAATPYLNAIRAKVETDARMELIDQFLSPEGLARLYGTTDLAISLADSDQLSSSILEALASGCLAVVSDLPAYSLLENLDSVIRVPLPITPTAIESALMSATARLNSPNSRTALARTQRAAAARAVFEEHHHPVDRFTDALELHFN